MDTGNLKQNARRASQLLKAIGNENRLVILCYLMEGEKAVGEMKKLVEMRQSRVSQYLARLRRAGLVQTRRSGRMIYYSLAGGEASAVMGMLDDLYCGRTQAVEPQRKATAG